MGVYLRDTASTWVPGPINVADELYNQSLPDLSTDPDVIAGGDTSVDEVDQRVGASVGAVSTFHIGRTDRIGFLLRTGDTGQLTVHTDSITQPAHVTNKRYVDDEISSATAALEGRIEAVEAGKADTAHTHTSAQITDSTFHVGRADRVGFLLRTGDTGQLTVHTDSITGPGHVTNKRYVDDEISSATAALEGRIASIEQRLTDAGL